jgi:hypothetical protein
LFIFGTKFATAVNKTDKVSYEKYILFLLLIMTVSFDAPKQDAYDAGEWFKFRIHYGIVNAGYATLEVKDAIINNKKSSMLWVKAIRQVCPVFFKVDDLYESYIDKESGNPLKYVRKINEGGYVKTKRVFLISDNSVLVKDYKNRNEKLLLLQNTQDILSAFYYLQLSQY